MWYNYNRKGKGVDFNGEKIQNKEEFLAAIKREKERRKKVAEAQEKKLAETEKKKLQTLIQKGR